MPEENPYQSDHHQTIRQAPSPMPLVWSLGVVASATVVFAAIGMAVGLLIASLAPGYYRSMFGAGADPFSMAVGLGLTQGAAAGAVIGVILVALFYWYRSRLTRT